VVRTRRISKVVWQAEEEPASSQQFGGPGIISEQGNEETIFRKEVNAVELYHQEEISGD
jgi:hypothetical protein